MTSISVNFTRKQVLQILGCAGALAAMPTSAQRLENLSIAVGEKVKALLNTPDDEIDFAKIKLAVDQIIDPTTDVPWALKKLDDMAAQVRAMLPSLRHVSSVHKVEALIAYLYQPGVWNKQQIFKYDLENDPDGTKIFANKLLANYIITRRGNCVSMPALFLILGQKLGLDITLSNVPTHVFVKFRDESGVYQNIETTSGGPKKNSSYQREFAVSQQAIDNGVYMRESTKQQAIIIMAQTLLEYYSRKKIQKKCMRLQTYCSNLIQRPLK